MVEFSLVKWHKCLGCHMVMEKGTHMDVNLSNIAVVYSAVVGDRGAKQGTFLNACSSSKKHLAACAHFLISSL